MSNFLDYEGLQYYHGKLIRYDTVEGWSSKSSEISTKDTIYVFTNYKKSSDNKNIAGIKIGDGLAYIVDLPYITTISEEHINNEDIHTSLEEKNKWNNKVTCYIDTNNSELLIFSKL